MSARAGPAGRWSPGARRSAQLGRQTREVCTRALSTARLTASPTQLSAPPKGRLGRGARPQRGPLSPHPNQDWGLGPGCCLDALPAGSPRPGGGSLGHTWHFINLSVPERSQAAWGRSPGWGWCGGPRRLEDLYSPWAAGGGSVGPASARPPPQKLNPTQTGCLHPPRGRPLQDTVQSGSPQHRAPRSARPHPWEAEISDHQPPGQPGTPFTSSH